MRHEAVGARYNPSKPREAGVWQQPNLVRTPAYAPLTAPVTSTESNAQPRRRTAPRPGHCAERWDVAASANRGCAYPLPTSIAQRLTGAGMLGTARSTRRKRRAPQRPKNTVRAPTSARVQVSAISAAMVRVAARAPVRTVRTARGATHWRLHLQERSLRRRLRHGLQSEHLLQEARPTGRPDMRSEGWRDVGCPRRSFSSREPRRWAAARLALLSLFVEFATIAGSFRLRKR
jgi:hypothetical protein